jgi:hypothetical protein
MSKKNVLILSALFLLTILCVFGTQYALNLCFWWDCAPKHDFTAADLSLSDYLFPEEAMIDSPSSIRDDFGTTDNMRQGATWGNGTGFFTYIVRRYPTVDRAVNGYNLDKAYLSKGPWQPSKDLQIENKFADESFSACGDWAGYRCEFIARYQEFVISINSTIDENMSYDRFETIAEYIDTLISQRLYP